MNLSILAYFLVAMANSEFQPNVYAFHRFHQNIQTHILNIVFFLLDFLLQTDQIMHCTAYDMC